MKVRIGYGFGGRGGVASAADFLDAVDALEDLGFDSLWLSERATGPMPDPLVGLAVAAGRTRRLKLGTSVQVLPGRNPALLAKAWATLDVLSDGRALPAFGLGVVEAAEQQAFGVARTDRAPWLEEALPLMRRLWAGEAVDHAGPRFRYSGLVVGPTPVRQPLDVWLGGRAPGELRRVGRLADGWLPSFTTPEQAAAGRAVVEAAAAAAGRAIDPEHWGALVPYTRAGLPDDVAALLGARFPGIDVAAVVPAGLAALREQLEAFVAVGFSKLVPVPFEAPRSWPAELDQVATAVLDLQTLSR